MHAGGRVLKAGGVAKERINAVGRVRAAGGVVTKGIDTGGRVLKAGGVEEKGGKSLCRVEVAGCVATEGGKTDGRVAGASREAEERIIALRGIAARIASVRRRDDACALGKSAAANINRNNRFMLCNLLNH